MKFIVSFLLQLFSLQWCIDLFSYQCMQSEHHSHSPTPYVSHWPYCAAWRPVNPAITCLGPQRPLMSTHISSCLQWQRPRSCSQEAAVQGMEKWGQDQAWLTLTVLSKDMLTFLGGHNGQDPSWKYHEYSEFIICRFSYLCFVTCRNGFKLSSSKQ